ncbi:hypothetical protein [Nocardioides limicola]|uniref:hypothetical protein n=1 Tax=Nocardioides limicola TaxID=2803368 RepID=UPI00193BA7D3|nr:hypothetical protein [Nocardioides sp. DJM-14]
MAVEIRVHGVGGSTPESLLDDPHPVFVWGDRNAGFYRRRDPGERPVEAYSWGGITSRSSWRVLWLVLLPFALANLAGWMVSPRVRAKRSAFLAHRFLVRVICLALTINLIVLTTMIVVDLWAYQCAGQRSCVQDRWLLSWWDRPWLADNPAQRVVLGAAVVAAVISLFGYLSFRTRIRYEQVAPVVPEGQEVPAHLSAAVLPGGLRHPGFWDGAATQRRLGRLHIGASLAVLALVLALSVIPDGLGTTLTVVAAAVLVAALVLVGFDGYGERGAALVMWLGAGCLAGTAAYAWSQPATATLFGHLAGVRAMANLSYALVFVPLLLLLGLVLWDVAGSRQWNPDLSLAGGPFTALALATALLNSVMLGLMIWAGRWMGTVVWEAESGLAWPGDVSTPMAIFPVIGRSAPWLTLLPLAVLLTFVLIELARGGKAVRADLTRIAEEYRAQEKAEPPADPRVGVWMKSALADPAPKPRGPLGRALRRGDRPIPWVKQVAWGRFLARSTTRLGWPLTLMALVGTLFVMVAQWLVWVVGEQVPTALLNLGISIAAALPVLGFLLLRMGWRDPQARRLMGILWDVGTFWPRCFHPLAPPSYAEKAVPDLQRRVRWLHDHDEPVLIAAHSQGTLLATAALVEAEFARAPAPAGDRVVLATFGSPLVKLYHWAFPAYLTLDLLTGLTDGRARVRQWRNFYTRTDYIGGPMGIAEVDEEIPDPPTSRYVYGQSVPAMGRHTGYWRDQRMWQRIDELAGMLDSEARTAADSQADPADAGAGPQPPPRPATNPTSAGHKPHFARGSESRG